MKSKKGAIQLGLIILIIVGVILAFGTSGAIKFIFFTDKTPLLIGGALILLYLIRKRKGR